MTVKSIVKYITLFLCLIFLFYFFRLFNKNGAKYLFLFENINLQKHLATNLQSAFFVVFININLNMQKNSM